MDELHKSLNELNENKRKMAHLIVAGKSEREIAAELNIPRTTFSYRKKQVLTQLKERLQDYK